MLWQKHHHPRQQFWMLRFMQLGSRLKTCLLKISPAAFPLDINVVRFRQTQSNPIEITKRLLKQLFTLVEIEDQDGVFSGWDRGRWLFSPLNISIDTLC